LQETLAFLPRFKSTASLEGKGTSNAPSLLDGNKISKCGDAQKPSTIFRDIVFAFLRISPPPGSVDFASSTLEDKIHEHGGQMLSGRLIKVMTKHRRIQHDDLCVPIDLNSRTRCCYVLCWGGHYTDAHIGLHPLLSQVFQYQLLEVCFVSPIWLETCIADKKVIRADRFPQILEPASYPMQPLMCAADEASSNKKLHDNVIPTKPNSTTISSTPTIRIALTGWSGTRRSAIIALIQTVGATYDDALRSCTTHLICHKNEIHHRGPKYMKALSWKIHIVSLDWLLHVCEHGYSGDPHHAANNSGAMTKMGCESRFCIR
jgi:hypothetical protein